MNFGRQKYTVTFVAAVLYFFSQTVSAVLFEPGVGVGAEYTDNATLAQSGGVSDLITVAYLGARVSDTDGALKYDVATASNNTYYTQKTLENKRYINLGASADWAMIKDRFNWFAKDAFSQRTVSSLSSNKPNNLQNTNVFTLGANIRLLSSARQTFSLMPKFNHYYFETLLTDNKQYSVTANWMYRMFRLTSVGLNFGVRDINYTEKDELGESIEGTRFTNMAMVINGQRMRWNFFVNLGATNVKREKGQETTGFAGYLYWVVDLSSRSTFETRVSTDFTDTSRVGSFVIDNPDVGGESSVQITTDVVRNSAVNFIYVREDSSLSTNITVRYRKVRYSESPLDREIRWGSLRFSYPVMPLLSSGAYMNYNRTEELETDRLDTRLIVGGDLRYSFSRKIRGVFDVKYRQKESTLATENYNEFAVFVSLVYGFGGVNRPTRAGEL